MQKIYYTLVITLVIVITSYVRAQGDPDTAQKAGIDRFSMEAGNLFVRDETNGFPGPNEPIDFDKEPFITKGLGNEGELIAYYNFDVMPTEPAPIYVLVREGESSPVEGQLNIIDVIPGDTGYNDFWDVHFVTVPANYIANTITSYEQILSGGYPVTEMDILVNCPVVPDGSTAKWRLNGEDPGLTRGWYKNQVVYYFNFSEKALTVTASDMVPLSPIYVTFNINPDQPGGGPPSGFVTEELTGRTHNVVATLPDDEGYSPLWSVNVYNNADFENVSNLQTALSANILATGVANVNCPVVATFVKVDRFSEAAGNLFIRDDANGFPGPNEPVDFDQEPFITRGLGPDGEFVSYYNFDVMPTEPAPIFVLIREGESSPVEGQMNIIDVIPGDEGYNDFWDVHFVTVPANYSANTITSYEQIMSGGYPVTEMNILVNCPVVPEGSTADLRLNGESPELTLGWYKNQVVYYFNFSEKALTVTASGIVPLSPIYVTFNINPDQPGGGPSSGFRTDEIGRTHNVVATLPDDEGYSPLWSVNVYNNADFENVNNLQTALSANILATGVANVNCPVVLIDPSTSVEEYDNLLPSKYVLSQNFPNPFNPSTEIRFSIITGEHISLKIYNSIGEEAAQLVNQVLPAGNYSVEWNAENVPSGIYFYTITTNSFKDTKKMILLK